jgi:RNA recognition motif-containing protein
MNKKNLGADQFLIVNYFVSKKDTELAQGSRTLDPISQNLTKTFNSNVYIKHIPSEVTEEELRKKFTFAEDAKIISLKLNTSIKKINEYEVKSQYAYIMYDTVGNAQKAIQRFDQQYLFGGSKPITVEMWVTKEEKELWATLPEKMQQAFIRREDDTQKGIDKLKAQYKPIEDALAPIRPMLQQRGLTEAHAVKQLFDLTLILLVLLL